MTIAVQAALIADLRAHGQIAKVLDADDQLTPGALARDLAVLDAHPDVAWTTSRVLDLFPDGSTAGFEHDPPEGRLDDAQVSVTGGRTATAPPSIRQRCAYAASTCWQSAGGWRCRPARTPAY